jgi:hypothetical protein
MTPARVASFVSFPAKPWRFSGSFVARRVLTESSIAFVVPLVFYMTAAAVLVFGEHLIVGDALSRVGSAMYMLFSRDPHLGAIGFVWGPLPTILMAPLVILGRLWPPLIQDGFAASVVSAFAMAFAIRELAGMLRDWKINRSLRWLVTILFALHPLIIQYGANGDSEALFILLLFVVVRQLSRWFETDSVPNLVGVALALTLAYLTRYETVGVAIAVVGLVVARTFVRKSGNWRTRLHASAADGVVVGLPFLLAFVAWAIASWIIVGNPFEQFTSVYGTSAQIAVNSLSSITTSDRIRIVIGQILGLEPFVAVAVVLGFWALVRRRNPRTLTVSAAFASVLVFSIAAFVTGHTNGWLRYEIAVIPMSTLLVGAWLASFSARGETARPTRGSFAKLWRRKGASSAMFGLLAAVLSAGLLLSAFPATLAVMTDPIVGREDHYGGFEQPRYIVARGTADYLDALNLPDGAVLVDTFLGFPIVLDSAKPRQFVVTSDRDFKQSVSDPATFAVKYLLVPESGGLGDLDAIERQWPGIYETGAGIGQLVKEFGIDGASFRWRLYELTGA